MILTTSSEISRNGYEVHEGSARHFICHKALIIKHYIFCFIRIVANVAILFLVTFMQNDTIKNLIDDSFVYVNL